MTLEEIERAKSPRGGWTKSQLAKWGVPWPPPKGWKRQLAWEGRNWTYRPISSFSGEEINKLVILLQNVADNWLNSRDFRGNPSIPGKGIIYQAIEDSIISGVAKIRNENLDRDLVLDRECAEAIARDDMRESKHNKELTK